MFRLFIISFIGIAACCTAIAGSPAFVDAPLRPAGLADVIHLEVTPAGDLVVLDNGFDAGLRPGMHCEVWRQGEVVSDIIIVAARTDRSVAVIPEGGPAGLPQAGDTVLAKMLQLN